MNKRIKTFFFIVIIIAIPFKLVSAGIPKTDYSVIIREGCILNLDTQFNKIPEILGIPKSYDKTQDQEYKQFFNEFYYYEGIIFQKDYFYENLKRILISNEVFHLVSGIGVGDFFTDAISVYGKDFYIQEMDSYIEYCYEKINFETEEYFDLNFNVVNGIIIEIEIERVYPVS